MAWEQERWCKEVILAEPTETLPNYKLVMYKSMLTQICQDASQFGTRQFHDGELELLTHMTTEEIADGKQWLTENRFLLPTDKPWTFWVNCPDNDDLPTGQAMSQLYEAFAVAADTHPSLGVN